MNSDPPAPKKLKQACLPFQILSPKEPKLDTAAPTSKRKRPIAESANEEVNILKVIKKSEKLKENDVGASAKAEEPTQPFSQESDHLPTKETSVVPETCEKTKSAEETKTSVIPDASVETETPANTGRQLLSKINIESIHQKKNSDLKSETKSEVEIKSPDPEKSPTKSQEGLNLQSHMKSNLATLFGRKVFDVTADVGPCDCGCEEADSEEEAMQEFQEHSKKRKASPASSEKKPKKKSKRKSAGETGEKHSLAHKSKNVGKKDSMHTTVFSETNPNPSKQAPEYNPELGNNKEGSAKVSLSTNEGDSESRESNESLKPAESTVSSLQLSGSLSQKAYDLFAKWRKGGNPVQKEEGKENLRGGPGEVSNTVELKEGKEGNPCDLGSCDDHQKSDVNVVSDNFATENEKLRKNIGFESEVSDSEVKVLNSNERPSTIVDKRTPEKPEIKTDSNVNMFQVVGDGDKEKLADESKISSSSEAPITVVEDVPFPLTPTSVNKIPQRRLTPKQLERQKETARKQEEKEKQKIERENEKKRLKLEKDEQKRKEKEEKEELRRKEKEEKEKKKQAELELKNEEKKKKELMKAEEKRKKEEVKKRAEEEKRKAEEEEERKKAKASAMFTSFFVPKSVKADQEDPPPSPHKVQNFMPFEVKADMRMAPRVRVTLSSPQKKRLDEVIGVDCNLPKCNLYLMALKSGEVTPQVSTKTWPIGEAKEDDDVCLLEADDGGVLIPESKQVEKMRAKFLLFHENHRPAYRGTWRKKSSAVSGRRPFGQDKILDYEVDSADEWEEEEPGESLHGSDDEKEQESEDEYEVDNGVFVPHGYLSDDEGDENEEVLSPETQKAKLKLLGEEFEAQMKTKTSALKPVIIMLTAALQASSLGSVRYQKLFERRAVWKEDDGPICLAQLRNENEQGETQGMLNLDSSCAPFSSGPGAKKKIISEEAIPALITLIHGNQNKRVFLTNEFSAFLGKSKAVQDKTLDMNVSLNAAAEESPVQPTRSSTPSMTEANPLALKWPGLPPASRISISNKIKEISSWIACPEEGPMYNKMCWYVQEETRTKYGLTDLKLPNTQWHYTLKPKMSNHNNSPSANGSANSMVGAEPRALITKFTKVMTPEEKQRQWDSMKNLGSTTPSSSKVTSAKGSSGKITAFTHSKTPSSSESKQPQGSAGSATDASLISSQPQEKKRVPLLVSVPRGQDINRSRGSLLSRFAAVPSSNQTTSALNSSNSTPSQALVNANESFANSAITDSSSGKVSANSDTQLESRHDAEDCIFLD